MPDREKVIKGLQCCNYYGFHEDCPYDKKDPNEEQDTTCMMDLMRDALALLKEQDAVEPRPAILDIYKSAKLYHCGICSELIVENQKYCHKCGGRVKLE